LYHLAFNDIIDLLSLGIFKTITSSLNRYFFKDA